jgi:hypothetical protein
MTASIIIAIIKHVVAFYRFDVIHSLNRVIANRTFIWRDELRLADVLLVVYVEPGNAAET